MTAAEVTTFEGRMAREIDRLVVGGHARAGAHPALTTRRDELEGAAGLLLPGFAPSLLVRPLTGDDLTTFLRYFKPERGAELFAASVEAGILDPDGRLTDTGRDLATAVVEAQEAAVHEVWAAEPAALVAADSILNALLPRLTELEPPRTPSTFALVTGTWDRPDVTGRVLRSTTGLRYWRQDAHNAAQDEAGLSPPEAHALNRAWMVASGIAALPGQGGPQMGQGAARTLAERGLLEGESITDEGRAVRDRVEARTDELTAPAYASLSEAERDGLYVALTTLPA